MKPDLERLVLERTRELEGNVQRLQTDPDTIDNRSWTEELYGQILDAALAILNDDLGPRRPPTLRLVDQEPHSAYEAMPGHTTASRLGCCLALPRLPQ